MKFSLNAKMSFIPSVVFSVWANGLMSRMFADQGSVPGRVIPLTQNMVLDVTLLNTQHYKVKWSNLGKGLAPSPTPWCSSY